MIFRKRRQPETAAQEAEDQEREHELVEAEQRADSLFQRVVVLQTLVMRRDQENHWQQAVNELFSGGKL